MNWVGILTVFLTIISIVFAYSRYTEYEEEVQRDLYDNLVGRTYPHFSDRFEEEAVEFQVINLKVKRTGIRDWSTALFLKFDMDEFPWEESDIDDWDYDVPVLQPAAKRDDVDTIDEMLEQELLDLCKINRKAEPRFVPEFSDSSYGPLLILHFDTKDLFILTEQLEMISEVIPLLFATWFQSMMGFGTKTTLLAGMYASINHSEAIDYDVDEDT